MKRNVKLTISINLELDQGVTRDELQATLADAISSHAIDGIAIDTGTFEIVALHDPSGVLTLKPWIEPILADFGQAASVWSIEDVLDICPSLTRDEALLVLRSVTDPYDCNSGIQRFSFTDAIENLLGIDTE